MNASPGVGAAPHPLDQVRLHRGAEHLHRLGPRAVAEFLAELGGRTGGGPACLFLLGEYGRLTPAQVRAAGGDRALPRPLAVVPRRAGRDGARDEEPAPPAAEPNGEVLAFAPPGAACRNPNLAVDLFASTVDREPELRPAGDIHCPL